MSCGAMENTMMNDLNINQNLSLYIRGITLEYANEAFIYNLFKNLNIGEVESAYFRQTGAIEYDTIIYMKQWYSNCMVETLQEKIQNPHEDARLVYNDPDYWVLYENNTVMYSELDNLHKLVTDQTEQLQAMTSQMHNMDWKINQSMTKIEHLTNKLDTMNERSSSQHSDNERQQLYTNNSCCGAASDAWNPSYPSTNIWAQRLRPRAANRATYM